MAKGQMHIGPNGPDKCDVTTGICPYESDGHFNTIQEADKYFERLHEDSMKPQSRNTEKTSPNFGLDPDSYHGTQKPREVQIEALNETAEALKEEGVTQLVAACGTGKSYMGRQLMREMMEEEDANGVAIVLTSSIKLATDTAADLQPPHYDKTMGEHGKDYEVIEVHSDAKGVRASGENSISTEKIAEQWRNALDEGKKVVIVSTYQSADKIQEVQAMLGERAQADLLMNDEAHNILGQKDSFSSKEEGDNGGYRSYHNEIPGAIQASKRLYATATPVVADSPDDQDSAIKDPSSALEDMQAVAKRMDRNGKLRMTVYSTDEAVVGKISGSITKDQAVATGCLADSAYHLRSSVIKGDPSQHPEGFVNASGQYASFTEADKPMTVQTYAAVSSTLQSMAADPEPGKNPSHNALAYCGSIDQAEAFQSNFKAVALDMSGNMPIEEARKNVNSSDLELREKARIRVMAEDSNVLAAHSNNSKADKAKAFGMFAGKDIRSDEWSGNKNILANVDIFSEGVSINEIDTVVIADSSKTSEKAMTQAIGRAARKIGDNEYKNTGHVIIPQALSESGAELNGGLVAQASYGATRVERSVSVRKLKGNQAIPADESTKISYYNGPGPASEQRLAASVARAHITSSKDLVAAQIIERSDQALRSISKGASPEAKLRAEKYRKASKSEQAVMVRQWIAVQAASPRNKDNSWIIADEALAPRGSGDFDAIRQSGRVATSALSAGDLTAVPTNVTKDLTRAGIIRKKTGSNVEPSVDEMRAELSKNEKVAAMMMVFNKDKGVPSHLADTVSSGVDVKSAMKSAIMGKGPGQEEVQKVIHNFSESLSDDKKVREYYSSYVAAANEEAKKGQMPIFPFLDKKYSGGSAKQSLLDLQDKAKERSSSEAASGSASFEVVPGLITKKGTLSADAQRALSSNL